MSLDNYVGREPIRWPSGTAAQVLLGRSGNRWRGYLAREAHFYVLPLAFHVEQTDGSWLVEASWVGRGSMRARWHG